MKHMNTWIRRNWRTVLPCPFCGGMTHILSWLDSCEPRRRAFHCPDVDCIAYESVLLVRDADDPDPVHSRGTPDKQRRKPQPPSA
jgi:hypothetical protein